jgi:hypothetical protein
VSSNGSYLGDVVAAGRVAGDGTLLPNALRVASSALVLGVYVINILPDAGVDPSDCIVLATSRRGLAGVAMDAIMVSDTQLEVRPGSGESTAFQFAVIRTAVGNG